MNMFFLKHKRTKVENSEGPRLRESFLIVILAVLFVPSVVLAQRRPAARPAAPATPASTVHDYASDLTVVRDAQKDALQQAKDMLGEAEDARTHSALEAAIKEMERAETALDQARTSPDKLPAALAAEQTAYQALLKAAPREFRVNQSRGRGQGQGSRSGQPNQRQLEQLDMAREENRYETERQATQAPNPQQREQLQVADRLKELAQRQQDVNERLRELQNALQAARTEQERDDLQRQLKRLRDEQRQMLSDVDEMRQQLERSPNATSLADARDQLDQTRSDMERASQEMDRNAPSQALAAGSRAQQGMQNLRDDLRQKTSSEFSEQMRQLRNDARDLARQEENIGRDLESLQNGAKQSLDDSAARRQLAEQLNGQQNALSNLLAQTRSVTEQSETSEPLLSRQLYDTLRRADQARTENYLKMGGQLVESGFLPQASEVERTARQNVNDLRQGIERAAESVLGSEAESLRYAQRELDDLTRQVERELSGAGTNRTALAGGGTNNPSGTNRIAAADASNPSGTNADGIASGTGNRGSRRGDSAQAESGQREQNGARGDQAGQGRRGEGTQPGEGNGEIPQNQPGQRNGNGQGSLAENNGNGQQEDPTASESQGQGNQPGNGNQPGGRGQQRNGNQRGRGGNQAANGNQTGGGNQEANGGDGRGGGDRLREIAQQLGQGRSGARDGGPITGGDFGGWADRLRDVERVLDPADLRNQLATARERASALRSDYRDRGVRPDLQKIQDQILGPMSQVRVWLREELARQENSHSLVPLDRDPVPENYSELVRKYYENLGSAQ